jgi:Tol biopolymer transport system component
MPSSSFFRRPAVLLALALCALAAVVSILGKLTGGSDSGKVVTLFSPLGTEAYPATSPDGKRLVYSVRLAKGEGYHLFVRDLPMGGRRQLTSAVASDSGPAWSPDGSSIAFLRIEGEQVQCMVAPAAGGPERKVADCGAEPDMQAPMPAVAWTPDGKSLAISAAAEKQLPAIALVPAEGGPPKRVTSPPEGTLGDSTPAVSPDGKALAFVRATSAEGADIYLCDLAGGNLERLTFDDRPIRGIAWMPDGGHLVYSAQRMGAWRLWRLPVGGGSPTEVTATGDNACYPAIAPGGGRLVYTRGQSLAAVWRAALDAHDEGQPLIRSTGREYAPSYSLDGQRIADISDQTGADEIWLSDSEGGHRVQLTRFKGSVRPFQPRWSPDGQWLLYVARGAGGAEVDIIPAAGGKSRRLLPGVSNASWSQASWSQDGKSIYYVARNQIWRAAADGSGQRQITNQGGMAQPEESPDGKYVYYRKWRSIFRVPVGGGNEEEIVQPIGWIAAGPEMTRKGFYYSEVGGRGRRSATVSFYDFATGKITGAFDVDRPDLAGGAVSPDGKYILYPRVDQSDANLMLVEGFR